MNFDLCNHHKVWCYEPIVTKKLRLWALWSVKKMDEMLIIQHWSHLTFAHYQVNDWLVLLCFLKTLFLCWHPFKKQKPSCPLDSTSVFLVSFIASRRYLFIVNSVKYITAQILSNFGSWGRSYSHGSARSAMIQHPVVAWHYCVLNPNLLSNNVKPYLLEPALR